MTAAIYCRLSREDEEKQSESESSQYQKSMLIIRVQNGKIVFLLIGRNLGGAGHPLAKELHELLVDFVDRFAGLL